jgi:hypothetical protein
VCLGGPQIFLAVLFVGQIRVSWQNSSSSRPGRCAVALRGPEPAVPAPDQP